MTQHHTTVAKIYSAPLFTTCAHVFASFLLFSLALYEAMFLIF